MAPKDSQNKPHQEMPERYIEKQKQAILQGSGTKPKPLYLRNQTAAVRFVTCSDN